MEIIKTTVVEFDLLNRSVRSLTLADLVIDYQDKSKVYWVHADLNEHEILKKISAKLFLPDPVVALCDPEETISKLIDENETLTMRLQCLSSVEFKPREDVEFGNLVIHLSANFCLTATSSPLPALAEFIQSHPKAIKYAKTSCFILFLILDNAINDYSDMLLHYEMMADQMDVDDNERNSDLYAEVMHIKQQVMRTKRYVAAIRDILMRISGRKISVVSDACRLSLSNVFDHSHMVVAEADAIREILNGIMDQINNALTQNISESMKVLTAFAAIFLPLSLIAGIYGMNFHDIPELSWRFGYLWALALMLACGFGLFYYFKRRDWI